MLDGGNGGMLTGWPTYTPFESIQLPFESFYWERVHVHTEPSAVYWSPNIYSGDAEEVSRIIADYRSDGRKESTKANAAHSVAERAYNTWFLLDAERVREADALLHAALVAQGQECHRPECADCKPAEEQFPTVI